MGETCNNSDVSRRTVLFAAASAAPLLALTGGDAQAKMAPGRGQVSAGSEGRQAVRRLQFFRRPQRLQDGRRRHRAYGLVRSVGQEGRRLRKARRQRRDLGYHPRGSAARPPRSRPSFPARGAPRRRNRRRARSRRKPRPEPSSTTYREARGRLSHASTSIVSANRLRDDDGGRVRCRLGGLRPRLRADCADQVDEKPKRDNRRQRDRQGIRLRSSGRYPR